jgi:CRISPR/Cas system endoribonuclease Cas6 (RAMP superfamily)
MEAEQSALDLLRPLRVNLFEFELIPEHEIVLPRWNKANVLRGAFGYECRRLVCGPHFHNDCTNCAALHHPLSGFTGAISFSGDLRPFFPFLVAGEWIGVGKNTVFGNGWYRITGKRV